MENDDAPESPNSHRLPVLAEGAGDISEGMVFVDAQVLARAKQAGAPPLKGAGDSPSGESSSSGPEEGYWAVAPGCGDISEGMVWMPGRSESED